MNYSDLYVDTSFQIKVIYEETVSLHLFNLMVDL